MALVASADAQTRVADAAEARDTQAVAALAKRKVDVNAAQADGATALHWAAHWNDLAMVRTLLAAGANPDAANEYGVTPLLLAATNGSAEVIGALLDKGANANASLPSGQTALMTAVRAGSPSAIKRLLAAGANPNAAQISKGQTALMWAATAQKVESVKVLIEGGAKVGAASKTGMTPLLFAAREGSIDVVQALLAAGADINETSNDQTTPILMATVRGHTTLAQFLLARGANADGSPKAGFTPLHYAASRFEHPFGVKNADLSAEEEWGALAGIPNREEKLALIDALLKYGANLEAVATRLAAPRTLAVGTSQGAGGRTGTPFQIAAMSGDAPLMRLLMSKGAKPVVTSPDGTSLVMGIISAGNAFTAQLISEAERIEAIRLALDLGADIEAQDRNGYRAMHLAAAAEWQQITLFLLEKGADLNPVTKTRTQKEGAAGVVTIAGQSPLGIVEGTFNGGTYNERPEMAAFLRKLGAKSIGRATLDSYVKQQQERQAGDKKPQ